MKTAAFIIGLILISCESSEETAEGRLEGFVEPVVQSQCRDRFLWIHVASGQTPHFEAVDEKGVHSISEQLASRCGYTISTFKMDGFTTLRASYYACFTHNQNDEVFTFRFNVMVSDAGGKRTSWPISTVCSGLIWTHREVTCEEDYMEVNVNRESSCGGQQGGSRQIWQTAFSQAQRTATAVWQMMILQSDGQVSYMSISEAQKQGYSLTTTAQRVVLRSQYKQSQAELSIVEGVPMKVAQIFIFSKQKLMMVMIDMSMACSVNSGSFDGGMLLWDVPRVVTPLVEVGTGFESRSLSLGVEGVLLDKPTADARGFSLDQQGRLIQIGIPFGAEGGYRKSLVVNNMYKETYAIVLLYEHIFSLLYEDGSSIDTRHRMLKVLETPLLCHPPFSLDQTMSDDQVFSVYLGNIPADVLLERVRINGKELLISESAQHSYSISPVVHINGSQAYRFRLAFEDPIVQWMYQGQGVVQYSIDLNFTLTIMPQREPYNHHTFITARVFNAFPPEITAQCSERGITFSVVRLPQAQIVWEVGFDHEPLTSQLVAQRGYHLYNNTHSTILEVPLFSIGYSYEDINLSNFYGTFELFLRDSKTLEIQTSTSKRCLFKTQEMIVCSADGTMTVVTTLTSTWPTVHPDRPTLLDSSCGPKQTDESKVLFEFKLDSCGTRAMAGESYMVYENEILHDRQMIADGPNFISRESQFRLTVRCFYPLSGLNRLSVDSVFRAETPGFGSVKVFKSFTADSAHKLPGQDCLHQGSGNVINTQIHQTQGLLPHFGISSWPKPGPSHFITVPAGHKKLLHSSQNPQTAPDLTVSPRLDGPIIAIHQVPLQVSSSPGHLISQTQGQEVFESPAGDHLSTVPVRYDQSPHGQLSNLNTPILNVIDGRGENVGLPEGNHAVGSSSSSQIPPSPVGKQLRKVEHLRSSGQTLTLQDPNSLGGVWYSGLTLDQATRGQNGIINPNQDLQSIPVNLSPGMQELAPQYEANLDLSPHGSLDGRMEPSQQTSQPVLQPQPQYSLDHISSELLLAGRQKIYVPANIKSITSTDTPGSLSTEPTSTATGQVDQNLERPGSIERRNIETVQSTVQNIRVKPLSKLVSSGQHPNHKPFVRQTKSQIYDSSQYAATLTANNRQELVPQRKGFSTLRQEPGIHSVQTAVSLINRSQNQKKGYPSLNQQEQRKLIHSSTDEQGHQHEQFQTVAVTVNCGGQQSASTQQNILQPTGESRNRVRLVPGLSGRLQSHDKPKLLDLQSPTIKFDTRGGTSRKSYLGLTPQSIPNSSVNIREYPPTNPTDKSLSTRPEGSGFTGSNNPIGSAGSDLGLNVHTTSDCGQYGASVHQGIMRGSPNRSLHSHLSFIRNKTVGRHELVVMVSTNHDAPTFTINHVELLSVGL